jgi:NAD(P)-dependent dehydrogenase (short-subunit alcohol dehydrogenase family)
MELSVVGALVTGVASGLGAAIARAVASQGAVVTVVDSHAERGEALAADTGGARFPECDVTNDGQVIEAVTVDSIGPSLGVVASCAGVGAGLHAIRPRRNLHSGMVFDRLRRPTLMVTPS